MATKTSQNKPRPPIVTVLGHVDHGKTTLLDNIRNTHVQLSETGGITQHIGAYQVKKNNRLITFIDTPGHAAFSAMRARGGQVADLAILVVAADDGVKPQTQESIDHINKAGIPFIVAINKVDLPQADVEKTKTQLAQHNVLVEGFGGNIPVVEISAKKGTNIDKLLETLLILADLEELTADPSAPWQAIVIESELDRKIGPLATVIVKNGTLRVGDAITLPEQTKSSKIRSLLDFNGQAIKQASPSTPVQILGFNSVPAVGTIITANGSQLEKPTAQKVKTQTEIEIPVILKADTIGTLEAIADALPPEYKIIDSSTGAIAESDILLADTTSASIFGFRVTTTASAKKLAKIENVSVKTFASIYDILDEANDTIAKKQEQLDQPQPTAAAKVLKIFNIATSQIIGARIVEGEFTLNQSIQIFRNQKPLSQAKIVSLRIGNQDQTSVTTGQECGLILKPSLDIKPDDVIIGFDS